MSDVDRNTQDTGTEDRMQGTGNQIKGRAEQALGSITGDREQQGKGMIDEAKGNLQQGLGDIKNALNNTDNNP